jgi:hypothetical protein
VSYREGGRPRPPVGLTIPTVEVTTAPAPKNVVNDVQQGRYPALWDGVEPDRVDDAGAAIPEVVRGAHDGQPTAVNPVPDQAGTLGQQAQRMPYVLRLDLVGGRHAGLTGCQDARSDALDDVADIPPRQHAVPDRVHGR